MNFKKVPFSISDDLMVETPINKLTPDETECRKCGAELIISPTPKTTGKESLLTKNIVE